MKYIIAIGIFIIIFIWSIYYFLNYPQNTYPDWQNMKECSTVDVRYGNADEWCDEGSNANEIHIIRFREFLQNNIHITN